MTRSLILRDWQVLALLDGRKTMIARPVKPPLENGHHLELDHANKWWPHYSTPLGDMMWTYDGAWSCPFGAPGDRLVCKETWQRASAMGVCNKADDFIIYRSTDMDWESTEGWTWKSSTQLPAWASRLTMELISVCVKRVQDVTEEEAMAMGVPEIHNSFLESMQSSLYNVYRRNLAVIWDHDHPEAPFRWMDNPWVWLATVKKVEASK